MAVLAWVLGDDVRLAVVGGDEHGHAGVLGDQFHFHRRNEGADLHHLGARIAAHRLGARSHQFFCAKADGQADDATRSQQPLHMIAHAKHRHAALGLMNAQEIERQRTALQALRQHMHRGVLPGNELAVAPDDSLAQR